MDVVTLGMAKADAKKTYSTQAPRQLVSKLSKGLQNAVLAVLGDSTGNDSFEWVNQTSLQLGQKFPKAKVVYRLWNDANQNYDAPSTLQAGVAPPVITDDFNRADSASTPGTATTGQLWTNENGTYGITSGKLVPTTAGGPMASINVEYPEITTFSISATLPTNGGAIRILPKFIDVQNHHIVEVGATGGSSYITIFKRVNNSISQYATNSATALTQGGTYTVTVTYASGVFSATVNGVTATTNLSTTDIATFAAATKLAVSSSTANQAGIAFDNLSVTLEPVRLDVYNGSKSGADAAYSLARMALQVPLPPDLTFINYGHNYTGTTLRAPYYALCKAVTDTFPNTDIVCIMQNPRVQGDSGRAYGLQRNVEIGTIAAQEGYGLVDVTQKFLDNPNYATDYYWSPETLHPNPNGHLAWTAEVMRCLLGAVSPRAARPQPRETRRFVPATSFIAVPSVAAPTLSMVNAATLGWAFDQTTPQTLGAFADYPSTWQSVNIYILWSVAGSSGFTPSNAISLWELGTTPLNDMSAVLDSVTVPALSTVQVSGSAHNVNAYTTLSTIMRSNVSHNNRPLYVQVKRAADQAADNLAASAYFYGVVIERAS